MGLSSWIQGEVVASLEWQSDFRVSVRGGVWSLRTVSGLGGRECWTSGFLRWAPELLVLGVGP